MEGITYNFINDEYYIISGIRDNLIYYHKTIFDVSKRYSVSVELEYEKSGGELGSLMCDQIHNSFKWY